MTGIVAGEPIGQGPRTGAWRATYTPGSWVVLAGPEALVVMPPAPAQMSSALNDLWNDVASSASIDALVSSLSAFGADSVPHLAVFFWDADGMHSLVRGDVRVIDLTTGQVAATGEGVRTWREVGLGRLAQVRIDLEPIDQARVLQLPLVVGAVTASAIVLDATGAVLPVLPVRDEVPPGVPDAPAAVEVTQPLPAASPDEPEEPEPEEPEPEEPEPEEPEPEAVEPEPEEPAEPEPGEPDEHPQWGARPLPAVLVLSTGERVPLTGPVLIGRAPNVGGHDPSARLVPVPSPGQDISRTHVCLTPRDGDIEVEDLQSTNGTLVLVPGQAPIRLDAGGRVRVGFGAVIDIGDGVSITVSPAD